VAAPVVLAAAGVAALSIQGAVILGGIACVAAYTASGAINEIRDSNIATLPDAADYFGRTGRQLLSQRYTPVEEQTVLAERGVFLLSVLCPPYAIYTGGVNIVHNVHHWDDHIEQRGTFWHLFDTAANGLLVYGGISTAPRWYAEAKNSFNATRAQVSNWWRARNPPPKPATTTGGMGTTTVGTERTPVIGRMNDIRNIGTNEYRVADLLPDQGFPQANWKQNSGVLRSIMNKGNPIRDASPFNSILDPKLGVAGTQNANTFLHMERNLLYEHGWRYSNGFWKLP